MKDLLRYGKILFEQNFVSSRGYTTVRVVYLDGNVYADVMVNGETVKTEKLCKGVI